MSFLIEKEVATAQILGVWSVEMEDGFVGFLIKLKATMVRNQCAASPQLPLPLCNGFARFSENGSWCSCGKGHITVNGNILERCELNSHVQVLTVSWPSGSAPHVR